jgi:hypothetical protein
MAERHDRKVRNHTYRVHDLIWLFTPRLTPSEADPEPHSKKLANYWGTHPWIITQIFPPSNVQITNIHGEQQRVHFNRIRPYISPLPGTTTKAPDGRPVVIHHIISARKYGHTTTYRVRWFPFNLKPDSNVTQASVSMSLILEYNHRISTALDPDDIACDICTSTENAGDMLLCDGCDKGFHNPCLDRTPGDIPADAWFCPTCTPFIAQHNPPHSNGPLPEGGEV